MSNQPMPPEIRKALDSGELGMPADLGNIERQLEAYFDDPSITRASLMNFAVLSERADSLLRDHELMSKLTKEHACRSLLVALAQSEPETRVRSWIQAHCQTDGSGQKRLCSEQISFCLEGDSGALLPNIIFSHLRSDLPLVVWWRGSLEKHFHERLYSRIDRLIIDSSDWLDLKLQHRKLSEALDGNHSRFIHHERDQFLLHDLAYTRGHQHRRAIAQVFDHPHFLAEITNLTNIEITYAPTHRPAALYLAAWLATQLQGTIAPAGPDTFILSANRSNPTIRLTPGESKDESIALELVKIETTNSKVVLQRDHQQSLLQMDLTCSGVSFTEWISGQSQSSDALVSEILMRGGDNRLLKKILPMFRQMVELG